MLISFIEFAQIQIDKTNTINIELSEEIISLRKYPYVIISFAGFSMIIIDIIVIMNLIKSVKSTAVIVSTPIELEKYEPMNSTPVKKESKIDIY